MKWASAVSTQPRLRAAVDETIEAVTRQLEGNAPDLLVAFSTREYCPEQDRLLRLLMISFDC